MSVTPNSLYFLTSTHITYNLRMKAFLFLSLGKSTKKNGAAQKYPQAALLFNRIYKEVCILLGGTVTSVVNGEGHRNVTRYNQ